MYISIAVRLHGQELTECCRSTDLSLTCVLVHLQVHLITIRGDSPEAGVARLGIPGYNWGVEILHGAGIACVGMHVTLAPSDPPSTTPPPTDVTAMAWDDLKLMVRSFNLTEMLQSEPPLPPRRLAALEQSVAAAVGSDAAVLVSAVHADGGSPRNKPPPLANGVPPPNWWIGRAVNVTFRVPRARVAAVLTCDSVEARWQLVQSAPSVNFSQGKL